MFIATLGVLDQYNNIWQAVSAISTARGKLAAVVSDIRAAELKQSTPTTGVTENKRLARRAMCQSAALVAGAVAAYADNAGKPNTAVLRTKRSSWHLPNFDRK